MSVAVVAVAGDGVAALSPRASHYLESLTVLTSALSEEINTESNDCRALSHVVLKRATLNLPGHPFVAR